MKILQLPSWYLPQGGQFCLNQSLALQEQGIEVHILANVVLPWRKYKFSVFRYPIKPFFTEENGIPMYRYYSWRYPFVDIPNIEKWVKKTVDLFGEYKEKYGLPDIIHVHSSMWGGYAAALIKEKYGVPYVITEHRGHFSSNSQSEINLFKSFYHPFLREAFFHADKIIAVSNQLHEKISSYGNKEITTISNIVDTNFFAFSERKKRNVSFTFINANSFDYAKGYDVLLPAFEKVCQSYPKSRLVLLGNGFNSPTFLEMYNKLDCKRNILFPGFQNAEGVRKYLLDSDCFVLSSRIESQSISVLEAMSCGIPVVCTKTVPAEIAHPDVAIQCEINSVESLSDAMCQMIASYALYVPQRISQFAKSICSSEVVSEKLITVYKEVLKND